MKKHIFLYFLCFALLRSASGQPMSRCSSADYLKMLQQRDPGLAERRMNRESDIQQWIQAHPAESMQSVITIPVVFHVLFNDSSQFLPDSIILSQLEVINEDYRRTNPDTGQTPLAFRSVAADCEIQFCLASRTPDDHWTNGIVHKYTSVSAFSSYDDCKFSSLGGDDGWDPASYLNIWVAAFSNPNFLGLGTFPNTVTAPYDGVVINYRACGRIGTHLMDNYNKGRSLTHEIGHWLNLLHIWGDDGSACTGDDNISDTPLQGSETYGCPSYPHTDNCSAGYPGTMFMNFLDYTDDECMNLFTQGQKARMLAALNLDRSDIFNSLGCISVGLEEEEMKNYFSVFPNPVTDNIVIQCNLPFETPVRISVQNITGETLISNTANVSGKPLVMNVGYLPAGIYFVRIFLDEGSAVYKLVKQ